MIESDRNHRAALKVGRLLVVSSLLAIGLAQSARADTFCASGPMTAIAGTTCDIGSLQFAFGSVVGTGNTYGNSDFTFTPVSNGFTLSFDGGPQSITAPADVSSAQDYAYLQYTITDLGGNITGENVSGGALSASGTGSSSSSIAQYLGYTYSSDDSSFVEGYNQVGQSGGTPSSSGGPANVNFGSPFSTSDPLETYAFPFWVAAQYGASASWDGTPTTFTYTTTNAVPEPNSLLLLGTGLIGVAGTVRRKLWR